MGGWSMRIYFEVDKILSEQEISGNENHATIYGAQLKEIWRPEQ